MVYCCFNHMYQLMCGSVHSEFHLSGEYWPRHHYWWDGPAISIYQSRMDGIVSYAPGSLGLIFQFNDVQRVLPGPPELLNIPWKAIDAPITGYQKGNRPGIARTRTGFLHELNGFSQAPPSVARTLVILDSLEHFGGADALSYSSAVCACSQGHGTAVAVALMSRLVLPWPAWLKKRATQGLGSWDVWAKYVNLVVGNVRQCSGEFRCWESGPAALFLIGKIHISLWSERSKEGKIGPVRSWEGFVWMVDKGIHEPGRVQPEHI